MCWFILPCKVSIETSCPAQGLDIGPDSLKTFQGALADAKTVIWNGPMGVFEFDAFAKGTYGVAETLAELTPKVAPADRICGALHVVFLCAMARQSAVAMGIMCAELMPGVHLHVHGKVSAKPASACAFVGQCLPWHRAHQ